MKILMVGAGAVGLVYGHRFQQAGHDVHYLVKAHHRPQLEPGATLTQLRWRNPLPQQANVSTTLDWHGDYDLIVLAIPSTALRQLDWATLAPLVGDTPVLMLQPNSEDRALLLQHIPTQQLAEGLITLIAYQAPLHSPKMNQIDYYLPPMAMPISAAPALQQTLLALFNSSGIRAQASPSAVDDSRLPAAFLMTFLAALEQADWQFSQLRQRSDLLQRLSQAQRRLLPAVTAASSLQQSLVRIGCRPWLYQLALRLAPKLVPLPLESYLRYHFIKVRSQTYLYLAEYQQQHPSDALADLIGQQASTG